VATGEVNKGDIEVMKVKGEGNLADGLTNPLDGIGTTKHIELTQQECVVGRHDLTPDFETAETDVSMISVANSNKMDEHMSREIAQNQFGQSALELLSLDEMPSAPPPLATPENVLRHSDVARVARSMKSSVMQHVVSLHLRDTSKLFPMCKHMITSR
jgi:hypothetical protein